MTLEHLGWDSIFEEGFSRLRQQGFEPARIAAEDKQHYVARIPDGPLRAVVSGRMLHQSSDPADLPKVGDWTAIKRLPAELKAVIHEVLPRRTWLSRKIAGRETGEQMLVTNIDTAFVVQALDDTFNPARLERMLVMVREGGARAAVILNKADLHDHVPEREQLARRAAGESPVLTLSALNGKGLAELADRIQPGQTVVFIGSSGVGKSTLINRLYGEDIQATADVREADLKGRHTTSWREMIFLPRGGIVIDTPGMREFHMWLAGQGLQETFTDIEELALQCRFRDCSHAVEKGCAVRDAVEAGALSNERYESFLKLQRELAYLEEAHEKRSWIDRKRRAAAAHRAFNKFQRKKWE